MCESKVYYSYWAFIWMIVAIGLTVICVKAINDSKEKTLKFIAGGYEQRQAISGGCYWVISAENKTGNQ